MALVNPIVAGIERQEILLFAFGADTGNPSDLVDLEIHRPGTVRHQVMFGHLIAQVNAIGPLGKQIDRGRAEQGEIFRRHHVFQHRIGAVEQDQYFQFLIRTAAHRRPQAAQFHEQIALWEGKILVQQSVTLKRGRRAGQ